MLAIGLLLSATVAVSAVEGNPVESAAAVGESTAYTPVGPERLADSRRPDCGCTRLDATTRRVRVGGRNGIPTGISAVAITITATRAAGNGYVTTFPTGTNRPDTSIVNFQAGQDSANSTIVRVGDNDSIDVYSSVSADIIVDVTGVFRDADRARAGRFVPVTPRRILDSRAPGAVVGRLGPDQSVTLPMPSEAPADAVAVAVNVTAVDAPGGYLTGHGAGRSRPESSFLNANANGTPTASAVILPTTRSGVTIWSSAGGNVLVDIVGYFTGPSAPPSSNGLFVPTAPDRILDTRSQGPQVFRNGARELALPFPDAAAIVTNLTLDLTDDAGFVTAYPAGTKLPGVSAVNPNRRDHTLPNMAITRTSTRGTAYFSTTSTHVIVDLNGYFTGTPVAATLGVPSNVRPPRRVLMVGDSTMAVLRDVPGTQQLFVGFDPVLDADNCRRLIWMSCKSPTTGRVPNTVQQAIQSTPGYVDVVVVMAGYNDWNDPFHLFVDAIMATSRAKGARQVIWLTYSQGVPSEPVHQAAYLRNTNDLWAAAPGYPDLIVADWRTYNSRSSGWMGADGAHLRNRGGYALADYISRWIAHLDGRPCPQPWTPGGVPDRPCPNLNNVAIVPDILGLYGV